MAVAKAWLACAAIGRIAEKARSANLAVGPRSIVETRGAIAVQHIALRVEHALGVLIATTIKVAVGTVPPSFTLAHARLHTYTVCAVPRAGGKHP